MLAQQQLLLTIKLAGENPPLSISFIPERISFSKAPSAILTFYRYYSSPKRKNCFRKP